MTRLTNLALSSVVICGLAACSASADEKLASKSETPSATVKTHAPHAAQKSHAPHATIKPGADVTMSSALPKVMTSGSYQAVQLRFNEGYDAGVMSVTVVPSAGLSLFGSTGKRTFNMAVPGTHEWDLDVKSDVDGVYFLNVFAQAGGQPRSFSVQLNIGQTTQKMFDDAMPADGEMVDGGKIRVMEAEETIK